MSYNIDLFKVKKLDNLLIPVAAFYKHGRSDWHPEHVIEESGITVFKNMESYVSGKVVDGILEVSAIECSGEGSGCVMRYMIEPALSESLGILIVSCVWEGGDSINQLRVNDGVINWETIEI